MTNLLDDAAELLAEGWCTAKLQDDGKFCALGAIAKVEFETDDDLLDRSSPNYRDSYANMVYSALENSELVRALAAEIRGNTDGAEFLPKNAVSVVYRWNDNFINSNSEDKKTVVQTFRNAARRLEQGE